MPHSGVLACRNLTEQVIGAGIDVHRELGPGYLESIYEEALSIELERRAIPFRRQHLVELSYRQQKIGCHRLDMLVDGEVVLELKAVRQLEPIHFITVRSYLKATDLEVGLLFNFATMPLTIKRIGRESQP